MQRTTEMFGVSARTNVDVFSSVHAELCFPRTADTTTYTNTSFVGTQFVFVQTERRAYVSLCTLYTPHTIVKTFVIETRFSPKHIL